MYVFVGEVSLKILRCWTSVYLVKLAEQLSSDDDDDDDDDDSGDSDDEDKIQIHQWVPINNWKQTVV